MSAVSILIVIQAVWIVKLVGVDGKPTHSSKCMDKLLDAWNYYEQKEWKEKYYSCKGKQQSPVDIQRKQVSSGKHLAPFKLYNYDVPVTSANMTNDGFTVIIVPDDGVRRGLKLAKDDGEYVLRVIIFHWGDQSDHGSEHTIDGQHFAMEEQEHQNPGYEAIVERLTEISHKGDNVVLRRADIYLECIVPEMPSPYFTYNGSLTRPDCGEGVVWLIMHEIGCIGIDQLESFRKLTSVTANTVEDDSCKLQNNYRDIQPLNGRKILSSRT